MRTISIYVPLELARAIAAPPRLEIRTHMTPADAEIKAAASGDRHSVRTRYIEKRGKSRDFHTNWWAP